VPVADLVVVTPDGSPILSRTKFGVAPMGILHDWTCLAIRSLRSPRFVDATPIALEQSLAASAMVMEASANNAIQIEGMNLN